MEDLKEVTNETVNNEITGMSADDLEIFRNSFDPDCMGNNKTEGV